MLWTLARLGSFEDRLRLVARAGYRNVELVDEFHKWSAADFEHTRSLLQSLRLTVDCMAGLQTGFADPASTDTFLADLRFVITAAQRLGCPQIILLSGPVLAHLTPEAQHAASVTNLKRAANLLETAGMNAVIEPIDRLEQPQIYLDGVSEAFLITRAVGSPRVKVLYDLYHEQRTHGNLLEKLESNIAGVGLIHVADVPGRHQPGSGEIDYSTIYRTLGRLDYKGVVAMEFYPAGDPVTTLRSARQDLEREYTGAQPVRDRSG